MWRTWNENVWFIWMARRRTMWKSELVLSFHSTFLPSFFSPLSTLPSSKNHKIKLYNFAPWRDPTHTPHHTPNHPMRKIHPSHLSSSIYDGPFAISHHTSQTTQPQRWEKVWWMRVWGVDILCNILNAGALRFHSMNEVGPCWTVLNASSLVIHFIPYWDWERMLLSSVLEFEPNNNTSKTRKFTRW